MFLSLIRCNKIALFLFCFLLIAVQATEKKLKVLCVDIHGSVAADVKKILEDLGHEVVVWAVPGGPYAKFALARQEDQLEIFNFSTWLDCQSPDLYEQFYEHYKKFFNQFDLFVAALNGTLAPLFGKTNIPTIVINAVRYEFPFICRPHLRSWLNEFLIDGFHRKKLYFVANNKGDKDYLKFYTGIDSIHIPSLCEYTYDKYRGTNNTFLLNPSRRGTSFYQHILNTLPLLVSNDISKPYTWEDLFSYRGIIHIPYQISTMSILEQYTANVPLFFPSKNFLRKLFQENAEIFCEVVFFDKTNEYLLPNGDLNKLSDPEVFNFWIDRADFYDLENMPYIQYFDSFQHLEQLLLNCDLKKISKKMQAHNLKRKENVYKEWRKLLKQIFKD